MSQVDAISISKKKIFLPEAKEQKIIKMTPRIITYFLCGMRHTTTGLSEDDLSRLTGSSSSTSSASSSSSGSSAPSAKQKFVKEVGLTVTSTEACNVVHTQANKNQSPERATNLNNFNNNNNNDSTEGQSDTKSKTTKSSRFNSTYLPEFINPLEWQKSRKRKERLDSTSSSTQDSRKLQRSNSEEQIAANAVVKDATTDEGSILKVSKAADLVIRRVSSEDFKRLSHCATSHEQQDKKDTKKTVEEGNEERNRPHHPTSSSDENDSSLANRKCFEWVSSGGPTKDMRRRSRYETSPMRSQRYSPSRAANNGNTGATASGKYSDDSDYEHERRRSSERFCKVRAPPGRKAAGVSKKSSTNSTVRCMSARRGEESAYLAQLKHERRGFISKRNTSSSSSGASSCGSLSDHNENNLIDFHHQQQKRKSGSSGSSATPAVSPTTSTGGDGNSEKSLPVTPTPIRSMKSIPETAPHELLPWDRSGPEDQAPILSRRYCTVRHRPCDSLEFAAKLSKAMPYPQHSHKQMQAGKLLDDDNDPMDQIDAYRSLTSLGDLSSSDIMQKVIPAMMSFQSPDERLKQINKRLTAMKKKLIQLEEAFEVRMGYRPSQAERLNDKYMKNIMSELSKLRKERHELKADPMVALGRRVSGGMDPAMKLEQMKITLGEIEKNLADKRKNANRPETLEHLTSDQLVQEKSAVQHALLYFETQHGRPISKDERDVARPLYDRYRQLKRLVSRSVITSGSVSAGAPELPTILEDETMVFETSALTTTLLQYSSDSGDNSPTESVAPSAGSSDDSTTTTTTTTNTTLQAQQEEAQQSATTAKSPAPEENVNLSELSLDELWVHLEKLREDKKLLKRTIREYEADFEEQNGRKMLKNDRRNIEETYAQYKEKKAKTRLLQALIKKHMSHR